MTVSQKVQIDTFDFGASLTAPTLGALATGTTIANGTSETCNEQTADSGVYIADFVGADASALIPAGTYRLRTAVNGLPLKRFVTFAGVDGELVYARSEEHAELNSAGVEAIADEVQTRTIARVTLVDTASTVTDGAKSATALSTAQWTNTRAAKLDNLDVALSVIQTAITNLNNLSAKANVFGAMVLEIPDSGTAVYQYTLVVRDDEDKLVDLDASPTLTLTNASGTDRSALLSAVSSPSTGQYTWTATVGTATVKEGLTLTATGAVSGETRIAKLGLQVVDYDTATQINTILSRIGVPAVTVSDDIAAVKTVADLGATSAALTSLSSKIGTPAGASVSADIAAVKADSESIIATLAAKLTSAFSTLVTNLTAMITGSGASAKFTTVAMSNVSGGSGGSGTESDLMVATTIATLSSQTVFTLTDGSPDNDAYNDQLVVITDADTSTQKWRGIVSDYVGGSKTVTLRAAPGFTIAVGDAVSVIAVGSDVSSTQLAGAVSSAIATAGITTTVTGVPSFLRVGDARTVANGGAIAVRLYDASDDSLLFGLGTQLFADATITFSLRRSGNDGTEGEEEAVIPCTWVASGGDGYVQIAYEGDALDGCDAMDKLKEKDCHRWGIKFQWGDEDPITPVYGTLFVLRKIVSTQ